MMRKVIKGNSTILRNISSSQEGSKVKKGNSASGKDKVNMSSISNSISSTSKSRLENSTGNKNSNSNKKGLGNSQSNKSLKTLRQNAVQFKNIKKDDKENQEGKKGTILVKNIKNKVLGGSQMQKDTIKADGKGQGAVIGTPRSKYLGKSVNVAVKPRESKVQELSMDMFEVGRKLGKGRFGDVYMARHIKSGFALAIKVISKKELREAEMEAQLVQEIKVQMYCNHPNVLRLYGFFHDHNKIYLLLELATHGCLFKEIRQKAYFDEPLACYYFRQVCSGVRYLHSHSVIHRDLKPENILNCFDVLKICDFGWAIYSPIYQRQTFCGTLDYVPPEIVTGDFYDEKADVWCLGVLCYELCTGKAPFQSRTDENETYDKILKVDIQFPLYMSAQVVDFIGRILNREPQKRMNLEEVESHEWMRTHENESGRMISKEVWDAWIQLVK